MKISAPYRPGDPEIDPLTRAAWGLEPGEAITVEDTTYTGKSLQHSISNRIRKMPGRRFHCAKVSQFVVEN